VRRITKPLFTQSSHSCADSRAEGESSELRRHEKTQDLPIQTQNKARRGRGAWHIRAEARDCGYFVVTKVGLLSQSWAEYISKAVAFRHAGLQMSQTLTAGYSTATESNMPFHQSGGRTVI